VCGNSKVEHVKRGRHIVTSPHLFSHVCRLTGAPAYTCLRCGHQYHDWRPIGSSATSVVEASSGPLQPRAPQKL
jgi:hypothetical protein